MLNSTTCCTVYLHTVYVYSKQIPFMQHVCISCRRKILFFDGFAWRTTALISANTRTETGAREYNLYTDSAHTQQIPISNLVLNSNGFAGLISTTSAAILRCQILHTVRTPKQDKIPCFDYLMDLCYICLTNEFGSPQIDLIHHH